MNMKEKKEYKIMFCVKEILATIFRGVSEVLYYTNITI